MTSIQAYLDELLGRRLVESKVGGTPSSALEAAAVLETVATTLIFQPRTALYLAYLARNGLLQAVQEELALIDQVLEDVADLANPTYAVTSTKSLEQARASLSQVGVQGQLTKNGNLQRFELSVQDFLTQQLGKTVLGKVQADVGGAHGAELATSPSTKALVRPAAQAEQELPADFSSLQAKHANLLYRFYSLVVGIQNFQATPLGSLLGVNLAARVEADLEGLSDDLALSSAGAQDAAVRLLAARAALRALSSPPGLAEPAVDTAAGVPAGYVLTARTPSVPAVVVGGSPVVCGAARGARVETAAGVQAVDRFPLPGTDLSDRALLVGNPVEWPVTIPAQSHLFVALDGTAVRVPLNGSVTPVTLSLVDTLAALNGVAGLEAVEAWPGSGRLAVIARAASTVAVATSCVEAHPALPAGAGAIFTSSAHTELGFAVGASAEAGETSPELVAEAVQQLFGALVSVSQVGDDRQIASLDTSAGAFLELSVPGFPAARARAAADSFTLYGSVGDDPNVTEGGVPGPVSPAGLVGPGDLVLVGGSVSEVQQLVGTAIQVAPALPTFTGDVVVVSALTQTWALLNRELQAFLPAWLKTRFAKDLTQVDAALAPLYASSTESARGMAAAVLHDLRFWTAQLADVLARYALPGEAAAQEKEIVAGLVATLVERKFDRARDLLLKCRIREVFSLDWQTVSYSGELMNAMSDLAQRDIRFPNRALDEGMGAYAKGG